ncbi:FUSC family protein [Acidocella sp. KAb 2-4]|uniref:FUSC family protein n=1 Tax=Acidocella sp. KAb 2-4 TaxID=2885158 RepID=UPI001D070FAB|nr:FUSC family protein [Acidocella sp. KAb 2-4]MCB5943132.1 FUSC family protein [Acidocella sp. KAb 2-4]
MKLAALPITLNPRAVSLTEGLRAGIAVAVTLIAGQVLHIPQFGLAALGALLTCFADPGGPVARRVPAVAAFALGGGVAYGLFGYLGGVNIWVAVLLAGVVVFCGGFARIYGAGGQQVGTLLSVVTVLALGQPQPSMTLAALQGLNFWLGAAWAAVLTLVLWQTHPYGAARRALADTAQAEAALARELAALAARGEGGAAFAGHAAKHRRAVREAIETARGVTLETLRWRASVSPRAAALSLRLQSLERSFAALIALSDLLEQTAEARQACIAPLRLIAGWFAAIAADLATGREIDTPRRRAAQARLRARLNALPEGPARQVLLAIAEQFSVLRAVSVAAVPGTEPAQPQPWRRRVISPIRQNLNHRSLALRHAARAALIATPATAWMMVYGDQLSHWMTITLVYCLQPYFSATWVRTAERMAGTMLGGLLAAGLGLVVHSPFALAMAMLPLTVLALAMRAVNFSIYIALLTPMIVLLVEQLRPGMSEESIALWRMIYTLLGGALAVAGNMLLWPRFAAPQLEASISAAIAAHAAYAGAVFAALLDGAPTPDGARRAAGLASNNLEAALARAVLEPHQRHEDTLVRGAAVDAALRRMAGRLSLLTLDPPAIPERDALLWRAWRDWLVHGLDTETLPPRPALPAGGGAGALVRLARQVELLARK